MEVVYPYNEDFREFKTCRLCGSNNKENIDIFTSKPISPRAEDLLTKILTVYPLVLYKNDPLPQHICPKCIGNVSTTYQGIQQVIKQQTKWMNLTKAVEPEHKYFRILNAVENATNATKESIKTSYNIAINNIPLGKFLADTAREYQNVNKPIKSANTEDVNETVVKNIQNKLESNGFTIKRIKVASSTNTNQDLLNVSTDSAETSANIVTCKHCKQKFSDLKILAQHQLIHLKVNVNKVFQKHLLPKHLRRGRLITFNDNKCIRCLNCWRIHKDNKAILQHWSSGECEFYCSICGSEFPHSPKMLRDHVIEIHGISYRSIKSEFMSNQPQHLKPISSAETDMYTLKADSVHNLNAPVVKKVYKKPPPKSCTKNDDGTITCKICHKVFDNFRSSNSHMRKHKPPNRIREAFITPSAVMDKYNTEDDYGTQPSTSKSFYTNTTVSNSFHNQPPRPPYKVIMTNGGIKTKIVQKRHDFLSNFAAHNRHPPQRSMTSTPDINDDENLIVPELLTPEMKLSQRSSMNDIHNNNSNGLEYGEYGSDSLTPTIKSEPIENAEYVVSEEQRICFICNENFSSSRDYELHAMFVHNIN